MIEDTISEDLLKTKKRKKAKLLAFGITFIIFCLWISYFVFHTKNEYKDKEPFALFENLKQNTRKPIEDAKGFFNEIMSKFQGATSTTSNERGSGLEVNSPAKNL